MFRSLSGYDRSWLRGDLIAGLTVWAVLVPEALAYHTDARVSDHVVVLRVESGLYFANADNVRAHVLQAASADGVRAIVLDAETIPFIDVTASQMLAELAEELQQRGKQLLIARDVGQLRDVLTHVVDSPALEHVYPTVAAPVDAAGGGRPRRTRRRRIEPPYQR